MFESVTLASHNFLQSQIDELKVTCDRDPAVAEMMRYILAYSDQMAYCGGDEDARIGRQIITHIWEISGMDFSNMGNNCHFSPGWVANMNNFIGNYVYDDSGFDFEVSEFNGTIDFKPADYSGRWLQNPLVIVEAARANRAYYKLMDHSNIFDRIKVKCDSSKVMELVK
jgi:hypothetical protein